MALPPTKYSERPAAGALTGSEIAVVSQSVSGALTSVKTTAGAIAALTHWGTVGGTLASQTDLAAAIAARVASSLLGIANGVATLATDGTLVSSQIPASLLGQMEYISFWDASAGTPPSGSPVKGQYWIVDVAGSTSLDGITDWKVGDWAVRNTSAWGKIDNTDAVSSVAGLTGVISAASLQTALGLGDAAYTSTTDYATAAQGVLAGTALQPDAGGQLATTARRRKIVALGNITGALNIDLASGDIITGTLIGNVTASWVNLPASPYAADIELRLAQDSTGGRTFSAPAGTKYPGTAPYVLTPTIGTMDVVSFTVDSAGNSICYPVEAVG